MQWKEADKFKQTKPIKTTRVIRRVHGPTQLTVHTHPTNAHKNTDILTEKTKRINEMQLPRGGFRLRYISWRYREREREGRTWDENDGQLMQQ